MKAKVNRGNGFSGLIFYAFGGENTKRGEIVGGNMSGKNEAALIKEFALVRRLRPDAIRPVWHCSLSVPKGEKLSADAWKSMCKAFMKKMGFSDFHPYVVVRHSDTDHDHVHIIASRIGIDSKLWHGKWEVRTAIEATQVLEKEHGLTITKGLSLERSSKKNPSNAEVQISEKTGEEPPRVRLQRWVDELVLTRPTALKFAEMLRDRGVTVRANIASTGTMNGFSFAVDGIAFKGSDLGKSYTWAGLQARGVTYDQKRDAGLSEYRAGVEPPPLPVVVDVIDNKLQLQQFIQIEIAKKSTAVEFAKSLRARGVIVVANIASTGTMNGFSFELNGAVFKSSSLGNSYSWLELQKKGISYDKDRDAEGLRGFRRVEKVEKKEEVNEEELVSHRPTVPSYDAYLSVRKSHFAAKAVKRTEIKKTHVTQIAVVLSAQKKRRIALFKDYDFTGKGELKSIIRSLLAAEQAKEKAALKAKHRSELDALNQRQFFPSYPVWKSANNLPDTSMPPRFEGKNVRAEISDIRDFVGDVRGQHIHYSSSNSASAFVDKGREISINDRSRASILASLQLSAQKWGRFSLVGGDDAFRNTVVELAAEHGFLLNNDDLRMRVQERWELARTLDLERAMRVPAAEPEPETPVPVVPMPVASGDLAAAKAERDRQPSPEIKQAAAAGMAEKRMERRTREIEPTAGKWPWELEAATEPAAESVRQLEATTDLAARQPKPAAESILAAAVKDERDRQPPAPSLLTTFIENIKKKLPRFGLGSKAVPVVPPVVPVPVFKAEPPKPLVAPVPEPRPEPVPVVPPVVPEPAPRPEPEQFKEQELAPVPVPVVPPSAPTLREREQEELAITAERDRLVEVKLLERMKLAKNTDPDSYAVTRKWMDLTDYGLSVFKVRGEKNLELVVAGASANHYRHELTQMGFTRVGEHFRVPLTTEYLTLNRWRQAFPDVQLMKIDAREILIDEATLREFLEANPVQMVKVDATLEEFLEANPIEPRPQNALEARLRPEPEPEQTIRKRPGY